MALLLNWLSRRSLRFLHAVGAVLGWMGYAASPSYRARLRANAALAGVTPAQRRASVAEAGKLVTELPRLWLRPQGQPIDDPISWQGAELITQAMDRGCGLILLTPHMGSFELCGQAYAQRFGGRQPLTALYRPARQPWLRQVELTARHRPGLRTAAANVAGVRQLMRALREGQSLGILPDQVPPKGLGVWAPFFGQPAYTMTLVSRLAHQADATVLLIWAERLPRGAGYRVEVEAMAAPLPTRAGLSEEAWSVAAATAINGSMESIIARKPEQYLWGYHRYKQPRSSGAGA